MELNQEKFQLLHHGKIVDLKLPYTLPSGQPLQGSDDVKDLGVYVDTNLTWRTHIATKATKANSMAGWILRTFITRDRRRERYTIILVWKIEHDILPNNVKLIFRETSRHGTTCIRPLGNSKHSSINTLRFNSFASRASALYNVVPPNIKSLTTLTTFKPALDVFLNSFPDTPPTPGYTGQNRNSVLEWADSRGRLAPLMRRAAPVGPRLAGPVLGPRLSGPVLGPRLAGPVPSPRLGPRPRPRLVSPVLAPRVRMRMRIPVLRTWQPVPLVRCHRCHILRMMTWIGRNRASLRSSRLLWLRRT
ncbi:unnamed protein product [Gadus morhua 'NCC']